MILKSIKSVLAILVGLNVMVSVAVAVEANPAAPSSFIWRRNRRGSTYIPVSRTRDGRGPTL